MAGFRVFSGLRGFIGTGLLRRGICGMSAGTGCVQMLDIGGMRGRSGWGRLRSGSWRSSDMRRLGWALARLRIGWDVRGRRCGVI